MAIDECDAVRYTRGMRAIIDKLRPEQEAEIQRRVRLVREGKAAGRSAENVFSGIHSKIRK